MNGRSTLRRSLTLVLGLATLGSGSGATAQSCGDYAAATPWLAEQTAFVLGFQEDHKALVAWGDTIVTGGTSGLSLGFLDATSPGDLRRLGSSFDWANDGANVGDLAVVDGHAYICADDTLRVVALDDPDSRRYVGALAGAGAVRGADAADGLLLMVGNTLRIVDIADPAHPTLLGTLDLGAPGYDVAVAGGLACVVTAGELVVVDVTAPAAPTVAGRFTYEPVARAAVKLHGSLAYCAAGDLVVVDISAPDAPREVGRLAGVGGHAIDVAEGFACVAGDGSVRVCDVTDPTGPRLLRELGPFAGSQGGVVIHEGRLFAFVDYFNDLMSSRVIEYRLTSATPPPAIGACPWPDTTDPWNVVALNASGSLVRALVQAGPGSATTVRVVDFSVPAAPQPVGQVAVSGHRVAWSPGHAFVLGEVGQSLEVVALSPPEAPRVVADVPLFTDETPRWPLGVVLAGTHLIARFEGPENGQVTNVVVDVSAPEAPAVVGTVPLWGSFPALVARGDTLFAVRGDSLVVLDLIDPLAPRRLGAARLPGETTLPWSLAQPALVGNRLYVATEAGDGSPTNDLTVVDVADPTAPVAASLLRIPPSAWMTASGRWLLSGLSLHGTHLVDLASPTAPRFAGTVTWSGSGCLVLDNAVITVAEHGLLACPPPCGDVVANVLADFSLAPADGAVDLQWWTTWPGGEFRLTAACDGESWTVPYATTSAGCTARDTAARLAAGGSVTYTLEQRDAASAPWTVLAERSVELAAPPRPVALLAPYPNPFNPRVRVSFVLARAQHVRLAIYDLSGRRLATLADGAFAAGRQEADWLGLDAGGARVPSGTYLLRIEGDFGRDGRKLTLVR